MKKIFSAIRKRFKKDNTQTDRVISIILLIISLSVVCMYINEGIFSEMTQECNKKNVLAEEQKEKYKDIIQNLVNEHSEEFNYDDDAKISIYIGNQQTNYMIIVDKNGLVSDKSYSMNYMEIYWIRLIVTLICFVYISFCLIKIVYKLICKLRK